MKYGIAFPFAAYAYSPGDLATRVEELGFDSLWFPEHTHTPVSSTRLGVGLHSTGFERRYFYDPMVACTAAAATTSTLKVGTGVCLIIERDPIITAKEVATVDQLSGGRFLFGIGAGWNAAEMANHGIEFKTRFSLMKEQVLAMKKIWTQEVAEFHGKFVNFDETFSLPKPAQQPHPPIHLGGESTRTLDRVADYCDGWIPVARTQRVSARLGTRIEDLRGKLLAVGREPDSVEVSLYACAPDRDVISAVEKFGVDRAVFTLPAEDEATVLKTLDDYARLIQ